MAIQQSPTAYGFERVNSDWSDADRAFFAALRAAGLPVTFDVKEAFYQWRQSFGSGVTFKSLTTETGASLTTESGAMLVL